MKMKFYKSLLISAGILGGLITSKFVEAKSPCEMKCNYEFKQCNNNPDVAVAMGRKRIANFSVKSNLIDNRT